MKQVLTIQKVLNNNVVIAHNDVYKEVVLIGNGLGFNRKKGDSVPFDQADKTFLLKDEKEMEQYVNLLPYIEEKLIAFIQELLLFIEEKMDKELNEHIHVALTDHIAFAINRAKKDIQFSNPFLFEIESLYPKEYLVAKDVVQKIEERTGVFFPEGEVGFIALHIHSAVTDKSLRDIKRYHSLLSQLVEIIENNLDIQLDKNNIDYHRLIQHLHRAIDRADKGTIISEENKLAAMLKSEYPVCYNLAWKLIKVMQNQLNKPVDESEVMYLTIHLQRLTHKF
ncbi:Beta-glucoside bgl operon antiterminator, BglG family [Planococcus halocryophilus Or1]|uniref:PtsGHI operon antiterminator n=1 Tax=Planococcus halocryophilus TaxID=1215089 RepID=A0A1C7DSY2_9BACL|nr:PRD domain-containing protein [Planococcus halocryophilus]ANU14575.1 PtsGHI operon antiterminator [Planococcus halocryophilus]EMF46748.1 Beta-glucoside bgl operon antiterminator, BglG family [Planococcus halocryophilus Or1]